jgi:hypothetical protein
MIDHERFRLLAAGNVDGRLTADEVRDLEAHLATCPICRAEAARLRRDNLQLVAALADVPVAARVRPAVAAAAQGRRRSNAWLFAGAAALLIVALAATAVFVGSRQPPAPSPSPSRAPTASPTPSASPTSAASASAPAITVNGAYAYSVNPSAHRRDSIAVRGGDPPTGTWSRLIPDSGAFLGGPVTCLVVDGSDAWMAGPATEKSEGVVGTAALLYVHDSGEAGGTADTAVTWITDPGQTIETMEGWCAAKYIPAGPYELEEGDIIIRSEP